MVTRSSTDWPGVHVKPDVSPASSLPANWFDCSPHAKYRSSHASRNELGTWTRGTLLYLLYVPRHSPTSPDPASECFDDNIAVEFIDGLLSSAAVERVERHVARCEACRQLLAELGCSPSLLQFSPTLPQSGDAHISLATGQQVGRFVVLSRIGSGGMGVVFAAYDPKLDRKVALKLLHSPEDPEISGNDAQMRLLREAQAIAQLSHPNVISVYDVGTYKSEVYIAMEFVEGSTLTGWMRGWERSWMDVLDKFVQAGKALVDAHAAGLVHRDFKPDNVLVGNDQRVRVMDFGLARWLYAEGPVEEAQPMAELDASDSALDRRLTRTGTLLGTPRYMAPEQFAGAGADARSDQFSFCVALYEALYKQHPFADSTAAGLLKSPETTQVRPPPQSSRVPAWLHKALLRGLSREAVDRYASMGALLRALAPMPRPQPRTRLVAPLAVAAAAVLASVYLYKDRADMQSDLGQVVTEKEDLEERLDGLEAQVDVLIAELDRTRKQLKDVRSQPSEMLELKRQLAETKAQLQATLDDLEQTQKDLAGAGKVGNRVVKPGNRPRFAGLREDEVRRRVYDAYWDFDVCFREWRERESAEQPTFAVRLHIDSKGVPRPGMRSGGLGDRVVYECVAGLLENLRFPGSEGITVVELGFRNSQEGLTVTAKVKDVIPEPPNPGQPAGAAQL
jgi:eukaryotic-like serine/threonine-protein kinase